jgi:alpha-L-rhamnosidase
LSKQEELGSGVTRRAFLGSSVTVTVGSLAMPAFGLSAAHAEGSEQQTPLQPRAIAFRDAKPIWPRGREKEMNLFVGFRAVFEGSREQDVYLRLAGATLYRVYMNGEFLAWGPARGPHGYYRTDLFNLGPLMSEGKNILCIEVAGYNVNSYYVLNQPSFLQAEVTTASSVLAATGLTGTPFEATILSERLQKVQRYSFQRSFSEVYRMDSRLASWRERSDASFPGVECSTFAAPALIPRRVPHPAYAKRQPEQIASEGTFRWGAKGPASIAEDRSVPFGGKISPTLLGYPEQELTVIPYLELQKTENVTNHRVDEPYVCKQALRLRTNEFKILDFGTNLVGFFGASITVHAPAKLYFTFDETLTDGDVDFKRLMCVNIVAYTLAPGSYKLETFEPYTLRFLKLMALEGECEVDHVYLREYTAPDVWAAHFHSSDEGLNELFVAGIETYRANAVDFFTDTPSRERAGWLCDSSFTAQVSPLLSGHTEVEKCFFENFLLPDHFSYIPDGMLPACYPADHYDGGFVPTWALWFLVQLEQYLVRSGDRELVEALRPRVLKLLDYFKPFQNDDGLLEGLKGLVFIEWSKSNDYVQDVSYPTNMLYAAALAAVGRMYNLPQRVEQAEAIRRVIRTQSYDGDFFVDNALRQGAKLVPTHNRTETCQYYAFYFDTASPEKYPKLWETLHTAFGPSRRTTGAFPEIPPSNAFMGNVMRLELLSRTGLTEQLASEAKSYFLYMAELTGTFWENTGNEASMDHAFGSHIVVALYRDVLGLYQVDTVRKAVHVRFTPSSLEMCEGRIPTPDGFISMRWTRTADALTYQLDVPAGYSVQVENLATVSVVQKQFPHGKVNYGYKIEGGYK